MNAEIILKRFQKNLDYEISQKTNPSSLAFFIERYGEKYFIDEDAVEIRGYYKGLKVAREMLQRIIAEEEEHSAGRVTNYDFVKNLSLEKMAEVLMCPFDCGLGNTRCDEYDSNNCIECTKKWLESEKPSDV